MAGVSSATIDEREVSAAARNLSESKQNWVSIKNVLQMLKPHCLRASTIWRIILNIKKGALIEKCQKKKQTGRWE